MIFCVLFQSKLTNNNYYFNFLEQIHIPAYSSSLHFELYKTVDGEHYIQLFYRKAEEESPQVLHFPGCEEKCPLNKFNELCQKFMPKSDIETECSI